MKSEILGIVGAVEIHDRIFITIDVREKIDNAQLNIRLEQLFQPFLGKKVRVTIEEVVK